MHRLNREKCIPSWVFVTFVLIDRCCMQKFVFYIYRIRVKIGNTWNIVQHIPQLECLTFHDTWKIASPYFNITAAFE